jgi:16S rRNA (adenine1518-N6/adenine1519-N6)-dimethyltransferase
MVDLLRNELLASGIDNVLIHRGDVLDFNFNEFIDHLGQPPIVMGNLPYNISSQILIRMLKNRQYVKRAVLMFQKELANRLNSLPGSRDYGRITVMLNYCAVLQPLMDLKPDQFFPKPKIDSTVLGIQFLDPPPNPAKNETFFFAVIKAAFGKRRKTLRNALSQSELMIDAKTAFNALTSAGIDPNKRAETLRADEFVRLADHLYSYIPEEVT